MLAELGDEAREDDGTSSSEAPEPEVPWADLLELVLDGLNGYLRGRGELGELLALSDDERKVAARTTGAVLEKYAGVDVGVEGACLAAWGTIFVTRALAIQAWKASRAPRNVAHERPDVNHAAGTSDGTTPGDFDRI